MKRIVKFIIICTTLLSTVFGQDSTGTFFEKGPNNMIRFYYDNDYYLVDKHCEFKFIERVTGFNISTNTFHGEFKDFDPNGRTILSGNYLNGSKEGDFKGFYPDGTLKWEATYKNNIPQGVMKYYYPDSKQMLELTAYKSNYYINQYWDTEGKHEVKDGIGNIDINLPISGFTEHGFTKYNVSGKVINGLAHGLWETSFINEARKVIKTPFMVTSYENGVPRGVKTEPFFDGMLIDQNSLSYTPTESFSNAELLQSKKCSFDEHTGFNNYIAKKFTTFLNNNQFNTTTDESIVLVYTIRVNKNGIPYSPTMEQLSRELTKAEQHMFATMIKEIPYYLPSYSNGKTIKDILTVSFQIITKGDKINIPPVEIKRENGI